ncbi:MAG: hypothetical protein OCU22_06925 [Canidatus Methanoxibalbensis ujae]|nr:hypothetical protein [Candidatus Methanoxibalbensis ujae]
MTETGRLKELPGKLGWMKWEPNLAEGDAPHFTEVRRSRKIRSYRCEQDCGVVDACVWPRRGVGRIRKDKRKEDECA